MRKIILYQELYLACVFVLVFWPYEPFIGSQGVPFWATW